MEICEGTLNGIAENILRKRYYQKDENGEPIENYIGLCQRVVNHVCKNESPEIKEKILIRKQDGESKIILNP